MYPLLYLKWIITRTYCIAQRILFNAMWQPGWEEVCGRMESCICMTWSLCCAPHTLATLLTGYAAV